MLHCLSPAFTLCLSVLALLVHMLKPILQGKKLYLHVILCLFFKLSLHLSHLLLIYHDSANLILSFPLYCLSLLACFSPCPLPLRRFRQLMCCRFAASLFPWMAHTWPWVGQAIPCFYASITLRHLCHALSSMGTGAESERDKNVRPQSLVLGQQHTPQSHSNF